MNTPKSQEENDRRLAGVVPADAATEDEPAHNNNPGVIIQLTNAETFMSSPPLHSPSRIITPDMFRQKFNGYSSYPLTAHLPKNFADNLSGKEQGNMSADMYHLNALEAWEAVTLDPLYYPAQSDAQIIADNTAYFENLGAKLRQKSGGQLVYTEMGVGGPHSLDYKTIPLARALGATDIGLLDYSESAITHAKYHLNERLPDVKQHTLLRDFNSQNYGHLLPNAARVFALLGVTLGNLGGPAKMDVPKTLSKHFTHYLSQMNKGDIFILSVDHNLDKSSLFRAYNETFDKWVNAMKPYLAEQFKGSGYNPDDFEYMKFWDAKNNVLLFGFKPKKDGMVQIEGISIHFKAGQPMVFLNSRRFIQDTLNEAYKCAEIVDVARKERKGLEVLSILPDRQKFISLQVLQAA